jgi:hypothetical protein
MTDQNYGTTIRKSELLRYDGVTRYIFPDYTPYPGLNFVLSEDLIETDIAELYITPGSEVFDLRLGEDGDWKKGGEVCSLADEVEDQEEIDIYVRANPISNTKFPINEATEGLIQITGEEEKNISLFTKTLNDPTYDWADDSIRLIIPTYAIKGTQVRFKFHTNSTSTTIAGVYFGQQDHDATFKPGKVQLFFSSADSYTGTTDQWTDWTIFEYDGSYKHILSWVGGRGRDVVYELDFSYYTVPDENTTSSDVGLSTFLTTGLVGIISMEVMTVDLHVLSVPLSVIVSRKFQETIIQGTLIDSITADVLENFGITGALIS